MKLVEEIRQFVSNNYFEPARARGEADVVVVSGEIHSRMKLKDRMPAVCSVLRGNELQNSFGVRLIREVIVFLPLSIKSMRTLLNITPTTSANNENE